MKYFVPMLLLVFTLHVNQLKATENPENYFSQEDVRTSIEETLNVNLKSQLCFLIYKVRHFDARFTIFSFVCYMGTQGLFLDAKNDSLVEYYKRYGFELIPGILRKMWLPISVIYKL